MSRKNYQNMSVEQLQAEYERVIKEHLIQAIDNVPTTTKAMMNEAIASIVGKEIGLRRSYGEWSVTYSQTAGAFVQIVRDAANGFIHENAAEITRQFLAPLTKEDTQGLKRRYREVLTRAVEDLMEAEADKQKDAVFEKLFGRES